MINRELLLRKACSAPQHTAPAISVIISWCNRPEVARTLAANAPVLKSAGAEIVLVNCAGDHATAKRLITESGARKLQCMHLPMAEFNKCAALNLGVSISRAPILAFLDADIHLDLG